MKTALCAFATVLTLTASVFAHTGAHAHPHGAEPWIAALGLALIAVAAVAVWRRK